MPLRAYTALKIQKEEEDKGLEKVKNLPALRTVHELFVTLINRADNTKKEGIKMLLKVFANGDVLEDKKNGKAYYINRENVTKAISPIDLKRAIHINTADYNIYVHVENNAFANEIELYKQFFPATKDKIINYFKRKFLLK